MLSRHAGSLFWMGRYVERAGDVTRMLDVAYNNQLEQSARSSMQVWLDLLRVLYLEDDYREGYGDEVSTAAVNRYLIFDRRNTSSVISSVGAARANVMNLRDIIPIEVLEHVNRLHTILGSGRLERFVENTPHEIYEQVAGHCRTITGAVDETMPRDDGYRFLTIGRMLERAEMTCRMLSVSRTASEDDISSWMTVLRSVSGFHMFTREHGPLAQPGEVVAFMLREPSFPFAVLHCLRRAAELTQEVSGTGTWDSPRVTGRLAAELEYSDIPPVDSPQLELFLEQIEDGIRRASEALHHDLFQLGGDELLYSFEAV